MPVVRVLNWPSKVSLIGSDDLSSPDHNTLIEMMCCDRTFKRQMTDKLRQIVLEANIRGIERLEQTTVSFDEGAIHKESRQIVILVEGFFDRQDRTHEDRVRLATLLKKCVLRFCKDYAVEVFVLRFDNVNEAYLAPSY
jgi:hypothetical protein